MYGDVSFLEGLMGFQFSDLLWIHMVCLRVGRILYQARRLGMKTMDQLQPKHCDGPKP